MIFKNIGRSVRTNAERTGDPTWLRLTELWTTAAKSAFQFSLQGQVATSTHAGLPWLRYLRTQCGQKVHFWPFEGQGRKSGRVRLAGFRIQWFDPIAESSKFSDHSRSAPLLRLFGYGWAPFLVMNSLVQVHPDAWQDPEFLKAFEDKGKSVEFKDLDQKTEKLVAIRAPADTSKS